MSKPVDVYVTEAELEEGRRVKRTSCLKVEPAVLRPVHCVSKPGISSGMIFAAPEPRRVGRYLTDAEMAVMYDKFVGPHSLNSAAVRYEQSERERAVRPGPCGSAAGTSVSAMEFRAPSIDSGDRSEPAPSAHMAVVLAAAGVGVAPEQLKTIDHEAAADKAAASATMKYVEPRIAKKYGITQSYTPAGARAAAAAAAGRGGGAYRGRGAGAGAVSQRLQRNLSFSSGGDDVVSGKPPRPPSAAFGAVPREKAQRTGSHFVYGGNAFVPAPGKYTPKYGATEKAHPALLWSKPLTAPGEAPEDAAGAAGAAAAASGADTDADGSQHASSAPAGSRRTRPSSAPASGPSPANAASAAVARPVPQVRGGLQRSASNGAGGGGGHRQPHHQGGLTAEAKAQLQHRHEEFFGAAHRVHPRKEFVPGSQPFKAVERKSLFETPLASHLWGEYYQEGYDSVTRRASRPSSAFGSQTRRHGDQGIPSETGPCLGPGSYGKVVPATNTGRHVPAGHPSLSKTPDWRLNTPRPESAPPVRPPPASAVQQGYWGPDGPTASLFPDEPDYNDLVAVRFLQQRTSQREPAGPGVQPRRAPSHQLSSGGSAQQQPPNPYQPQGARQQQQQYIQAPQQPQQMLRHSLSVQSNGSDAAALAVAVASAAAGGIGDGDGGGERPVSYITTDRLGALSSAGLAKRVPGYTFSSVTREGSCQAMRVMSKNSVTPPAAVAVKAAQDLDYDYDYGVEGHRGRPPAWHLPPNRNALSQQWMAAAAAAYLS